jgi:hypothetical protein
MPRRKIVRTLEEEEEEFLQRRREKKGSINDVVAKIII